MPNESIKNKQIRMAKIISLLKKEYPDAKCSLNYKSPFQLLVATILSAQCTDKRVNKVTEGLFDKYPNPLGFINLSLEEIEREIYSTGFYKNKAKSIKGMAAAVVNEYGGELPQTLNEMVKLPGVGRKTANVVLGNVFGEPSLVVDTHVTRIANLLQFVKIKDAVKIEKELTKIVERNDCTSFLI